jgi:hypothetical protein
VVSFSENCIVVQCENYYLQVLAIQDDGALTDAGTYPLIGLSDPRQLYPAFLTIGDFNGDGFNDLAAAGSSPGFSGVQILYGDGNDGFEAPVVYTTAGFCPFTVALLGPTAAPSALAVADQCGSGITIIGDASRQ